MKNLWILVFIVVVVTIIALPLFVFQVRQTEVALVTTFGDPSRTIVEPGLKLRWPKPINEVHKFDSRAYLYELTKEETNTKGGVPIIVTSYMVWKVGDPLRFLESVQDKTGAEKYIPSLLRNAQNSVVGRHSFSEFINSDPAQIKFEQIESELKDAVVDQASRLYGIDVKLVGIKQLGVSKDVTKEVFERMKADRNTKTEKIIADGQSDATKIKTDAESKVTQLLAIAEAEAKAIRGAGDAEAAKYYKLLEEEPELAIFLRKIEALPKILEKNTTILLGTDTEPLELLKEMPDLQPKTE